MRLPVELGPASSDEYAPVPLSPVAREAQRRSWAAIDGNARQAGLSRRAFLRSACGAATVLLALDACSKESARDASPGQPPGGTFDLPPSSAVDPDVATTVLGASGFVMDVQTHFLAYDLAAGGGGNFGGGFPQADCGEADARACFAIDRYLQALFLDSDTTVAVLSAIPAASATEGPLSISVMEDARAVADGLCGEGRLLLHGQAVPQVGTQAAAMEAMARLAAEHPLAAWKVYTHSPGPGWRLDRDVGAAFVDQAQALDVPRICVHKGFSGGSDAASPADVGPAAAAHPDTQFVVYHSGYEPGQTEGPYQPGGQGIDRLIDSVRAAGVGAGGNVHAELGSTWFNVMRDPTEAAHVLGKLLVHLGAGNVVWGTDSIWYGSPQGQLDAFRAFQITPEFQERFGYPALTDEIKARILGLNAARLYGIEPESVRCTFTRAELEEHWHQKPAL